MKEKTQYKGLAVKIFTPIAIVIIFTIISTIYSTIAAQQVNSELTSLQTVTVKKMEYIEDLRYTILHTAEILTDASATHEEEGFNEAAEFADEVHALIEKLQKHILHSNCRFDKIFIDSGFFSEDFFWISALFAYHSKTSNGVCFTTHWRFYYVNHVSSLPFSNNTLQIS